MSPLDELVAPILNGDPAAWRELQARSAPIIDAMTRGHESLKARGLHVSEDDVAELRVAILERLAQRDFHSLRLFAQSNAAASAEQRRSFDAWLYGAVDFSVREHLRKRYGRAPKAARETHDRPRPSKRGVNTLADRFDDAAPERSFVRTLGMTSKLTADAIFAHIDAAFDPAEARAMRMYYLEDQSFDAIASALGLVGASAADKLIRKLNARLRYKFADAEH